MVRRQSADPLETHASPFCIYQQKPCRQKGRVVYGPWTEEGEFWHRTITCLVCQTRGGESAAAPTPDGVSA